jgi:hypothetical protein
LDRTKIVDRQIEARFHLSIRVFRKADRAGLRDTLQSRGDVDAVAHQIAVALLYDVAKMYTDAKVDAPPGRQSRIALHHPVLNLNGTAHSIDYAAKFDQRPVAGALHHAPVMNRDSRINQIASECP